MKKGDVVEYINPMEDEVGIKYLLLEEPDRERVLAEALVDLKYRPTYILNISEIRLCEFDQPNTDLK